MRLASGISVTCSVIKWHYTYETLKKKVILKHTTVLSGWGAIICSADFLVYFIPSSLGSHTCRYVSENRIFTGGCTEYFGLECSVVVVVIAVSLSPLLLILNLFSTSIQYLTLRWLMSYIYGAPILDVSRSHTTTQHSR